jgi:hypothetical protein
MGMVAVAVGKDKFAPHLKDFVALSIEGARSCLWSLACAAPPSGSVL